MATAPPPVPPAAPNSPPRPAPVGQSMAAAANAVHNKIDAIQGVPNARGRRVSDIQTPFINALIYGDPKVGKTVFAASGPRPVYYMSFDSGMLSLLNEDDVWFDELSSYPEILEKIKVLQQSFARDKDFHKVVVVDNLTDMQNIILAGISNDNLAQQKDYGLLLTRMKFVVRQIRNLPCHTIFTAHQYTQEGRVRPALIGQTSQQILGQVDIIGNFKVVVKTVPDPNFPNDPSKVRTETNRLIRFHPTDLVVAGDRSGKLSAVEAPNLERLIAKISAPKST